MQLALQKLQTTSTLPDDLKPSESSSAAAPADVYTGGSAELDHTRKHGRYLADGAAEWTVAVVSILRGLLVNLFTLSLLTVVLGRAAAHLYAYFPGSLLQKGWPPPAGVSWAVGVAFALSVAIWVLRIWVAPAPGRRGATINGIAAGFAGLGALLAVLGIGFPLIAWVAGHPPGAPAVTGAAVSVLAAWVAAIVALGSARQ